MKRANSRHTFDLFLSHLESNEAGNIYVFVILLIWKLLGGKEDDVFGAELRSIRDLEEYRVQFHAHGNSELLNQMFCAG